MYFCKQFTCNSTAFNYDTFLVKTENFTPLLFCSMKYYIILRNSYGFVYSNGNISYCYFYLLICFHYQNEVKDIFNGASRFF
jgi:hypothetical protein